MFRANRLSSCRTSCFPNSLVLTRARFGHFRFQEERQIYNVCPGGHTTCAGGPRRRQQGYHGKHQHQTGLPSHTLTDELSEVFLLLPGHTQVLLTLIRYRMGGDGLIHLTI